MEAPLRGFQFSDTAYRSLELGSAFLHERTGLDLSCGVLHAELSALQGFGKAARRSGRKAERVTRLQNERGKGRIPLRRAWHSLGACSDPL